jgi:hypothetical protein
MLPNHRRYLIPSRPDPTRPRVKIQILAPQWSCHARPIYQKVLHTTGSRIMTSRHEASKTVRDSSDPAGDPCRTSPAHSVTNATNQKRAVTPKPIGEVAYVHMKKQANCLETRNAFTFVIILEASIALEFVSHPMDLSTQNTPSVLRKLWPVPPVQKTL